MICLLQNNCYKSETHLSSYLKICPTRSSNVSILFLFPSSFFFLKNKKIKPVQSHLNVTSSHRQHSSSPSQEKRQIPLKAKAQRCSSLPLNWPVTVMWAMVFLQFYVICITQLKHQPEPWKMLLGHIYLAQPLLFCYALSTDQSHNRDFLVIL